MRSSAPAEVLFARSVTGHFGKPVDRATLDFVKEFGLRSARSA
jgi:hypothetical protein